MPAWAVWYATGPPITDADCFPESIPGWGVQAIAQPDRTIGTGNVGWVLLYGHEWYYWRDDVEMWFIAENDRSMFDVIRAREPVSGVSSGMRLPPHRYEEILERARAWAETAGLPHKSGFRCDEVA